jgi:hypothetical protein
MFPYVPNKKVDTLEPLSPGQREAPGRGPWLKREELRGEVTGKDGHGGFNHGKWW